MNQAIGCKKFTDVKLKEMVREGLTQREIAERLGVSRRTVWHRLKTLKIAVSKRVALCSAGEVVRKELDTVGQIQQINRDANELLNLFMRRAREKEKTLEALEGSTGQQAGEMDEKNDAGALALKTMQEIRTQLKLQVEIFQALFDIRAVQQFQSEVLEVFGNVSPEARNEIVRRLTENNALRSTLDLYEA